MMKTSGLSCISSRMARAIASRKKIFSTGSGRSDDIGQRLFDTRISGGIGELKGGGHGLGHVPFKIRSHLVGQKSGRGQGADFPFDRAQRPDCSLFGGADSLSSRRGMTQKAERNALKKCRPLLGTYMLDRSICRGSNPV